MSDIIFLQPNRTEPTSKFKILKLSFRSLVLKNKLNWLNQNKSPGPDLIYPRILYELRNEISYPLWIVFDSSLRNKTLPLDWKSANVTAIYEKGSKSSVNNYRPVSLTSVVCKLLESFVKDTRSSATAEKQRVSCPHGGRVGLDRPAPSPSVRSGYTYAYGCMNPKATTYVRQAWRP